MFCMMILVMTMLFHTYLNVLVRNARKRIDENAKKEAEAENFRTVSARVHSAPGVANQNGVKGPHHNRLDETLGAEANLRKVAFLPGGKDLDENDDGLRRPRYFNYLAQIIFVLAVFIFMVVFWWVSLTEYLRDPASFLEEQLF